MNNKQKRAFQKQVAAMAQQTEEMPKPNASAPLPVVSPAPPKRTYAQIRASSALAASAIPHLGEGSGKGDASSGFPMMIRSNGLLGALAYAVERTEDGLERPKIKELSDKLAQHLSSAEIDICTAEIGPDLLEELAKGEAITLRRATAEALAWCSFLKRFIP